MKHLSAVLLLLIAAGLQGKWRKISLKVKRHAF